MVENQVKEELIAHNMILGINHKLVINQINKKELLMTLVMNKFWNILKRLNK